MNQAKATETLHTAVQRGDISYLTSLTQSSNITATLSLLQEANPKSGDRPVHLAARHGHLDTLELLMKRGVDAEIANLDGKRALHEAAAMGHPQCVDFLLKQGVRVDPLKRADW